MNNVTSQSGTIHRTGGGSKFVERFETECGMNLRGPLMPDDSRPTCIYCVALLDHGEDVRGQLHIGNHDVDEIMKTINVSRESITRVVAGAKDMHWLRRGEVIALVANGMQPQKNRGAA